jgi:hypothetical protein
MGPDSLVHVIDEHLADGVLERLRLVPDSRMGVAPNIDDLVESTFSNLFGRKAATLRGHHHHIAA